MPKSYHFSLGDSTTGPIGLCARVTADSPEVALAGLREALGDEHTIRLSAEDTAAGVEYIEVYFNHKAITVADIDEDEEPPAA